MDNSQNVLLLELNIIVLKHNTYSVYANKVWVVFYTDCPFRSDHSLNITVFMNLSQQQEAGLRHSAPPTHHLTLTEPFCVLFKRGLSLCHVLVLVSTWTHRGGPSH